MDVDQAHFIPLLLPILSAISRAKFVSFDVEMSGISTRQRYGPNDRSRSIGKPTLQEQYEETKDAAETYQILQIGITCVEEDLERDMYVARPYNFNLSPLFHGELLKISRNVTLSSNAMTFLMKNSFDVGAVFTRGVMYLSRKEEATSRKNFMGSLDRSSTVPDIEIPSSDLEALEFYERVRQTVSSWTKQENPETDYVNIDSPNGSLNGYQRRLVHQLIRKEFKGYRTFARCSGEFMQVEKEDPKREASILKSKIQGFETAIAKQTGFRWVFEALAGGDLSGIDPKWFCVTVGGEPAFMDVDAKKLEIAELQKTLKKKKTIVVGHNLFTDLVFIYKTFIGPLPAKVSEFQKSVHTLFPTVIDTKYLATHESGSMRSNSKLRELFEGIKNQPKPCIILADDHSDYIVNVTDHMAGYDSWLTAQIFAKLSAKLQAERKLKDDTESNDEFETADENFDSPDDGEGVSVESPDRHSAFSQNPGKSSGGGGQSKDTSASKSKMKIKHKGTGVSLPGNRFAQLNDESSGDESSSNSLSSDTNYGGGPFPIARETSLMDADIDENFRKFSEFTNLGVLTPSPNNGAGNPSVASRGEQPNPSPPPPLNPNDPNPKQWIPSMNSSFWNVFANKLRVFGTATELLELSSEDTLELRKQ